MRTDRQAGGLHCSEYGSSNSRACISWRALLRQWVEGTDTWPFLSQDSKLIEDSERLVI